MIVVSDTSPISNLAKIGQLGLMQQIYGEVLIPQAVYEELLDKRAGEIVITAVESATWLQIEVVQNQELVNKLRNQINIGESEAIALAVAVKADQLLIDERLGRQSAIDLGLQIIGVVGILLTAKHQGLILAVKPVMDALRIQASFRISSQLYEDVLNVADE